VVTSLQNGSCAALLRAFGPIIPSRADHLGHR
jgi:hypothetical protein